MVSDFKHLASGRAKAPDAGRASFQVALASAIGFGVEVDLIEFEFWVRKSANQGLKIGSLVSSWLQCQSHPFDSYLHLFRNAVRVAASHDALGFPSHKSNLQLACMTGDFDELMHLLGPCLRVGSFSLMSENISPLHLLFMFDSNEIVMIVERLCSLLEKSSMSIRELCDQVLPEPIVLDPQLPLELVGPALATAVAAASLPAVEALLLACAQSSEILETTFFF
jgi:hypothetical protein